MSNAYTLGTRVIYKRSLLQPGVVDRVAQTILLNGGYLRDVQANEVAEDVIAELNAQERAAAEYRAQFTSSEWAHQEDEAAGG